MFSQLFFVPLVLSFLSQGASSTPTSGNNIRNERQKALSSLQARGDTKFDYAVSSVATAFKAMWSQSKINQLDQRLRQIQSEMTMALLVSLW